MSTKTLAIDDAKALTSIEAQLAAIADSLAEVDVSKMSETDWASIRSAILDVGRTAQCRELVHGSATVCAPVVLS